MNKCDIAFEIALKCRGLSIHLMRCPRCRKALRKHKPKRMCEYGYSDVDTILHYLSKYDDDWELLYSTVDRMM